MPSPKSTFLDKVLNRLGRLDSTGLQSVVERLARERRFLETLFNAIEDGVIVLDEEARILYFNRAATHLLGLDSNTAEGQPIADHLPGLDWAPLASADREGGERVFRHEFEVHYPRHRFVRLMASPLDGDAEGKSGMVLILHDATEARQRTRQVIEDERAQTLTLLAASVAHEIGNPLNALHIHLQLIERELRKLRRSPATSAQAPPARRSLRRGLTPTPHAEIAPGLDRIEGYLGVARGEIARLDYIITQFLQALRPTPPRRSAASLNQIVRETLELLRPEFENRGLEIVERLAPDLPKALLDPAQIKQVLVNLAKNAMQAMSRGGVLTLTTAATDDSVWVGVGDTGGGIPGEQVARLYEPFFTTKKKGSGLGLLIVQRIVRDHNGRIELDNHLGHGATFRIWLPRRDRLPRLLEAPSPPNSDTPL